MRYLIDTNVLSELRKMRGAHPGVRDWAETMDAADLYLSVVTIFETQLGVLRLDRKDKKQADLLRVWLETRIVPTFADRILPIEIPIALECAKLHVPNPQSYRVSLIAATAIVHGMTVVTRNVDDFARTGVALLNPWQ
jgi:predicted nucleic acid-binding protein